MEGAASRPWSPDVELSPEDAARRIAEQFPALAGAGADGVPHLEPLGRGWDNDAYLVNGSLVFRFPRRRIAAVCLRNEIASLPAIARSLPLPVPDPTHVGEPTEAYPYPFAGYARIAGRTACSVVLDAEDRRRCAAPLGRFLAALHALPVPGWAPEDPAGRKDVAALVSKSLARIEALSAAGAGRAGSAAVLAAARATIERLAGTAEWDGVARWSHGDLYVRHLLVDEGRALSGVIDWGDVHAGETADDLSIAF